MVPTTVNNGNPIRVNMIGLGYLIFTELRNSNNSFCFFCDKTVLPFVVYTDKFITKDRKVFGEKFAVNVVEENNTRRKGQTGVPEIENGVLFRSSVKIK